MSDVVNLERAFESFSEAWAPRVAATLNGQQIRLARLHGDFVWHRHDDADEGFLVLHGTLVIHLRDRDVTLHAGELFVVPAGVEHRPETVSEEVRALLFAPAETRNTGNVVNERTTTARPL